MGDLPDSQTTPTPTAPTAVHNPRPMPWREDCWSEDATFTLIDVWGMLYLDVNRGNLSQKHWQEVAGAVNARHARLNEKARRTDVQCKNRIDTLKKKYKIEKARVLDSNGSYRSNWPFFTHMDSLIGSTPSALKKSSPGALSRSPVFSPSASVALPAQHLSGSGAEPPMAIPLRAIPLLPHKRAPPPAPVATVVPQKRPSSFFRPVTAEFSDIRNNYSTVAAAAAAGERDEEEDEELEEDLDDKKAKGKQGEAEGLRKLARAIERFGEVYLRVEADKQRQIVELEKQRMQFAKELECQRMQMLVDMQDQLEKVKRVKRHSR